MNTGAVTTGHGTAHATTGLELFEFGMQSAAIVAPVAVAQPVEPGVTPAIARATVTRSTPRTRLLRRHQRPPS